jgi:hypothetical protein
VKQQKKKDSDQKSSSTMAFGGWSFHEIVGTTPNEGAQPERRGLERRMNEPRGPGEFI